MLDLNHLRDTLNQLDDNVLTLYLYVDNARRENQAETPAWQIELKNALQNAEQHLITADAQADWDKIRPAVERFFRDYQPSAKSLLLFADANQVHTHELPLPLGSAGHFGEPFITPLLWAIDEYEMYLIVQVDHEKAHFISGYLGSASTQGEMRLELDDYDFRQRTLMPANNGQPDGSANASGGNNREQYDSMIEAHRQRFYRDVADHVRELLNDMGNPRLILSGDEKAAHELQVQLAPSVRQRLAGIAPAPMRLTNEEALDAVMDTALAHERGKELELVNQIINDAKAGGRAALGHADVVNALIEQRVETLVLPYPPTKNDLANDLKLRAFEGGTQIELVHGTPAAKLEAEGGVGATLYYTYQPETEQR